MIKGVANSCVAAAHILDKIIANFETDFRNIAHGMLEAPNDAVNDELKCVGFYR